MLVWLSSPPAGKHKCILLDRDGVINENRPDYVKNIHEFKLYPDALEALKLLHGRGVSVIIISNQSGINRGLIPWDDFWGMHDGMVRRVERCGGNIRAAFYCPHRPDEHCACRKPSPAMILSACRLFNVDPTRLYFIGDHDTDMAAAANAGCRGLRIRREDPRQPTAGDPAPDGRPAFPNLLEAVLSVYG